MLTANDLEPAENGRLSTLDRDASQQTASRDVGRLTALVTALVEKKSASHPLFAPITTVSKAAVLLGASHADGPMADDPGGASLVDLHQKWHLLLAAADHWLVLVGQGSTANYAGAEAQNQRP